MGTVVQGELVTTSPLDTYPTHLSSLGRGNVNSTQSHADRNALSDLRREEGMLAYTSNDSAYWKLNPAPWSGTDTDWVPFTTPSSTPPVGPLTMHFPVPSLQWEIFHELGRYPSVQLIMDDEQFGAVITFPEEGRVLVTMQEEVAGIAILRL